MIFEERFLTGRVATVASRVWFLETEPLGAYEKILPLPFAHLIVNLSDPYRLFRSDGTATVVADAFVSGLQSDYLVIESPPQIRHVGLELAPAGLHALAPGAGVSAAGRVQDARALLTGIDEVVERLGAVADVADPAPALDVLEALARTAEPVDELVASGLSLLGQDPETTVTAVAEAVGSSPAAFIARFRGVTGVTPKQHAQVVRFHRFVSAVHESGGAPDWAALAVAAGYYDQPHVIRAFRRFSGWTPTEYYRLVAEHGPMAAHFVPLDQVPTTAAGEPQAPS
ncbi:AraC family transcriptional regulator [Nostocoides sp. F2B08]|uniref:helix-turn-helix domain-containing protein n=1 Tax=Nostocoides sp. F2B08 TaxID=2653936 RepID=UPI00186ACE1F|nr:AraC family transcriptional regulator [Tetrasphaera sp. F2B08]